MFKEIYNKIKKCDNIVIVRHIGADPDALCSQFALRDSIKLTFPKKNVLAWGSSNSKFNYLPKLDKFEDISDVLLIIVDTPDRKRVDFAWNVNVIDSIKIDHHPFIEKICELEYIDDTATSASEIILQLINQTPLKLNNNIAEVIYTGIVSDTNRFMFNSSSRIFSLVSKLIEDYKFNIEEVYSNLFLRPLSEVRLQGYMGQNMVASENGLGYIKISNDVLNKFEVDVGSSGNIINNFNYIEGVIVWVAITEDVKNKLYKVNIRSRGPVINFIAEKYNGGGHKLASGAKLPNIEMVDKLLEDLDVECKKYKEEVGINNYEN